MTRQSRRRMFLQGVLVTAAGGLAGCSNDADGDDEDEDEDDEPETTGTAASTATDGSSSPTATETEPAPETETQTATRTPVANPKEAVDNWLSNTDNYDGTITDERGEANPSVTVGADGNKGDGLAFDPAAIRTDVGTQVTWSWTGRGGAHNVVEKNGRFDSGATKSGGTFSYTFDEPGVYLYKCENHGGAVGQRGAVIVGRQQTLTGYPQVDEWLDGYDFDGRLDDKRMLNRTTIDVGAEGNGGNFAFDPPAILVESGTDIVFDWTGRGGQHNITWEQGNLPESTTTRDASYSHTVTVTEPGVYLYECSNHAGGARGAIVVQ